MRSGEGTGASAVHRAERDGGDASAGVRAVRADDERVPHNLAGRSADDDDHDGRRHRGHAARDVEGGTGADVQSGRAGEEAAVRGAEEKMDGIAWERRDSDVLGNAGRGERRIGKGRGRNGARIGSGIRMNE